MNDVLISADELRARLHQPQLRIADVRSELSDPEKGGRLYAQSHLPGAIYAHLNRDLSDLSRVGFGRHPLPTSAALSGWLASIGYRSDQSWVIYDDGNAAYASRLWWMLRAIGHRDVRVLDGGFQAWIAADAPVTTELPMPVPSQVDVLLPDSASVGFDEADRMRSDGTQRLVDARGAARFRGDVEPIDPVAGHVPGAINRPFSENLTAQGLFKSPQHLRAEWTQLLGDVAPDRVAHMCGSGVTACQNLLAMEHAGLRGSRPFAPSWSGWISDPSRPVAVGPD